MDNAWAPTIVTIVATVLLSAAINGGVVSYTAGKIVQKVEGLCKRQDKLEDRQDKVERQQNDLERKVWQKHSP
jgi:hypothetical protein